MGEGESQLGVLKEKEEDVPSLRVLQGTGALPGGVLALGSCQEDASLGSPILQRPLHALQHPCPLPNSLLIMSTESAPNSVLPPGSFPLDSLDTP